TDVLERVDLGAVAADLEMQVRAGGIAGRADLADDLAGADLGPDAGLDAAEVRVEGAQAVGVHDLDEVAVAAVAAGGADHALGRGQHARAGRGGDVDALVAARGALAGEVAE